jgi:hypothetical protein
MSEQTQEAFETWWYETGSQAPSPKDDMYEHCKKIALMAWKEALSTNEDSLLVQQAHGINYE